jgi:16S rRNA processing protein RimM
MEKKRVFLEIRSTKVPFFIKDIRGAHGDIVLFEDIPNREAALLLQSKKIYLLQSDVPDDLDLETDALQYSHLAGYTLLDETLGLIGAIEEVIEMPQQEMAVLQYQNKEVLVPLNAIFIKKIDDKKSEILMDLPDGLLTI